MHILQSKTNHYDLSRNWKPYEK